MFQPILPSTRLVLTIYTIFKYHRQIVLFTHQDWLCSFRNFFQDCVFFSKAPTLSSRVHNFSKILLEFHEFRQLRMWPKEKSKISYYTNTYVILYKYKTLGLYFLLFMLHVFLLNRCIVINYANVLFRTKKHTSSFKSLKISEIPAKFCE